MLRKIEKDANKKSKVAQKPWLVCIHNVRVGPLNRRLFLALTLVLSGLQAHPIQAQLDSWSGDIIVAQSAGWDSTTAQLQCFHRASGRVAWQPFFKTRSQCFQGDPASHGAAVCPATQRRHSLEGGKRLEGPGGCVPARQAVWLCGKPAARHPLALHQVGPYDAFVDDPQSRYYNQHVRVDPANIPPWFREAAHEIG